MSAGMSHTHWTAKLFIKKKVNQSAQSNSHTLTDSHFHIKKKKKKKMLREAGLISIFHSL